MRLFPPWSVLSAIVLAACGTSGSDDEHTEAEPDVLAIDTAARGLIDCTEYQDTGYTNGNAFTITVVTVDGKPAEVATANAYYVMQQAAAGDGVDIAVVSGFRTMAEQEYLYGCYVNCNCNNCNLAARPGYSNHQSGHALDLNASHGGVLDWLNNNGGAYGFSRTVPSENWHWEWWGGGPGGGPCGQCRPHCEGSVIVGQDCGRGDCGVFGSRCVDDAIGVRCAAVFCPDVGEADICVDTSVIGHCNNGALETGDCGEFAAFCSTTLGSARCVSAFCVASPNDTPIAHDTCLPDGQRYHCDEQGGLAQAPCPEGQVCETGRCVSPGKSVADPYPTDDPTVGGDTVAPVDPTSANNPERPQSTALSGGANGGCSCAETSDRDASLFALLALGLISRRARVRRNLARP